MLYFISGGTEYKSKNFILNLHKINVSHLKYQSGHNTEDMSAGKYKGSFTLLGEDPV